MEPVQDAGAQAQGVFTEHGGGADRRLGEEFPGGGGDLVGVAGQQFLVGGDDLRQAGCQFRQCLRQGLVSEPEVDAADAWDVGQVGGGLVQPGECGVEGGLVRGVDVEPESLGHAAVGQDLCGSGCFRAGGEESGQVAAGAGPADGDGGQGQADQQRRPQPAPLADGQEQQSGHGCLGLGGTCHVSSGIGWLRTGLLN